MPKRLPHRHCRRPSWFRPVPLRARADGWSEVRQCGFLAAIYVTGSVAAATRSVGMSRESAFRLRTRKGAESFARAWDRVLTPPGSGHLHSASEDFRKVTLFELNRRLETDLVQPVIYRGRMCAIRRKPDNSALFPAAAADRRGLRSAW
jgi:hypothetical protein